MSYIEILENIYVTGDLDPLGHWSADKAVALSAESYPIWSATLTVPANRMFSYKYLRKSGSGVSWENDPNRSTSTPNEGDRQELNDTWK